MALVVNSDVFRSSTNALDAYSSPVSYATQSEYDAIFLEVAANMIREQEYLQSLGVEMFRSLVFGMCRFAALCTKHPGFKEEQEWRVVHSPSMHPSKRLIKSVETIRGIPQRVYKIPLADVPEEDLVGLAIPSLINRIIIGPTEYPRAMADAFGDLLEAAGVQDANNKVWLSEIPLRQT